MIEGLTALALLVVMCVIAIATPREPWTTVIPIALLFPILLWIAARCRPVLAAAAVFVVTLAIVWTTTIGIGRFGDASIPMTDRVLAARGGILAVALCAYVLAALFAERRRHESALAESEARLQEALTAGAVTTFVWDADTGKSERSVNAAQILGFDPRQNLSASPFLLRIHPDDRQRFNAFVRGVTPERLTLDVTARKRSADQQSQLIAALDYHVKNLLSRISVVARGMRQNSVSLDAYVQALERRLESMVDAHSMLSQNLQDGVELSGLVRRQLAPYAADANTTVGGPNIALTVAATQALAMAFHELVTNAANYGALSTPHGRVEVSWNHERGEHEENLSIEWREVGGPTILAPPQGKYGVGIIRNLIPNELGGSVELVFESSGVLCRINIPFKAVRAEIS